MITDNDSDVTALRDKYKDYLSGKGQKIRICYDEDQNYPTLEPQLLKANSRDIMNKVLGKKFGNDKELLDYMAKNKTDCALKVFNSNVEINIPDYINNAIK